MADATQGVDLITSLGGSGGTTGAILFAYHNYFSNKMKKELKDEFSPLISSAEGEALKSKENTKDLKSGIESKVEKLENKIKDDREAFRYFMEDNKSHIERLDASESKYEDLSVELKHKIEKNTDRVQDIKTGQNMLELRLNSQDERERKHYEELSKMSADNKVMDQRLAHIEEEQKEMKLVLVKLTDSVQSLRDAVVQLTAKMDR